MTIVTFNTDHCSLPYRLSDCLFAYHALISKCTGHLNRHLFAGPWLPQVDHHRDARSDGHPFIAAVEVAVSEPAPAPVWFTFYRAFGGVLNVLSIRDPNSRGADVARDDRWQVRTASHGSVDTQFNAP